MILIRLSGGLGNQMFQYAFARALQQQSQKQVFLDKSSIQGYRTYELHHFQISLPLLDKEETERFLKNQNSLYKKLSNIILPYYKKSIVEELYYHYDSNLLKIKQDAVVKGYFQSEKYFKEIENLLRKEFAFKEPPSTKNAEMLSKIQNTPNAVSVHIRRGDFVGNKLHELHYEKFLPKAISALQSKIKNFHLFLFSNDFDWVEKNLRFDFLHTIVDINNEQNAFEDLRLMSACQHHIIANSSFSWWGAWLNTNPNKIVIAPAKWVNSESNYYKNLKDIIPETWIKIQIQ